ncbi:WGR domain-containing protein [Ectothiorhodospiraceae bacterium 2226]|nr:WGR domain-containing protein [Ectothiorhodospiraceae bacterium 2226]
MRIYMQTPPTAEGPPRFCQLMLQQDLLEGWTLIQEAGAPNGARRIKRVHYPSFDAAEAALVRARDAQIARGYRVMFVEGVGRQ